ncbi:MAG: hypothetical protein ACYDIA_13610 [Candidatus Humimicrobiaceae bacterium]
MSHVLEALQPNLNLTTSNLHDDWLSFLDDNGDTMKTIKKMKINLPKFSLDTIGYYIENWKLGNTDTAINETAIIYQDPDIFYEITSPVMPPINQLVVNIIVDKIEKGYPSICDEVEL